VTGTQQGQQQELASDVSPIGPTLPTSADREGKVPVPSSDEEVLKLVTDI
jgi:hypothetical protein